MMTRQRLKQYRFLVLLIALLLTTAPLAHAAPSASQARSSQTNENEIIAKLDVSQPGATIEAINQTYGTTTIRALAPGRVVYLLQAPAGADPAQVVNAMGNDVRILYAELNRATDAPEAIGRSGFAWGGYDPTPYNSQYPQQMLGLPAAHAISQGAGVVVAVIDTGVQLAHPDLAGHLTATRIDFVDGDNVPEDEFSSGGANYGAGHGTHVAGIIHLVAPQARIMPIRVLDTDGRGYSFTVAEAILFAVEHGAHVINLSLGMPENTSNFLEDVIDEAAEQGVVVVAAVGNLNSTQKQFPAAAECALAVTAIDPNRVKADFASYGGWVSLAAPGVGIHSTLPVDGYGSWSGTSMAAPFVAGQAALLLALNPNLNVVQVADLMGGAAVNLNPFNPGHVNQLGMGQIDVHASLLALQAGNIPDLELLDDDCSEDDDNIVNVGDLVMIANLWGQPAGSPHDRDGDGLITIVDIQLLARHWGLPMP